MCCFAINRPFLRNPNLPYPLAATLTYRNPHANPLQFKKLETEKRHKIRYFQNVANRLSNDNIEILSRKKIIEKKKEDLERIQHIKILDEKNTIIMKEEERKKKEEERLAQLATARLSQENEMVVVGGGVGGSFWFVWHSRSRFFNKI